MSCDGGSFLHILRTDVRFRDSDVEIRSFSNSNDTVHLGGNSFNDFYIDHIGNNFIYKYSGIVIDEYTFEGESSADVYLATEGGGPVQYSGYELVGSFELEKDFFPFGGDYNTTGDGSFDRSYIGENFEIIQNGGKLTIKCRTSPDSEFEEIEISLE